MSFDKDTNTITLDDNSDFLVDAGVFFIHNLKTMSSSEDAPKSEKQNWGIIKNWLDSETGEIGSIDEARIGKAWKSYLAIGVAPSFNLQEAFDFYSNKYKEEKYSFKEDKPPTEVMDVFDKLLATDKEISVKKYHDWAEEKKKIDAFFKTFPKKKQTIKQRISSLSKNSRLFIVASLSWFIWVWFRTVDDWKILGIYLDNWDGDMFFANLILPIVAVFLAYKAYKRVSGAK